MVGVLAWAYVRYGSLPAVSGLLYGVKPVVIAVILQALWKLGGTAMKSVWLAIVGLVTVFLSIVGVSPLLVLLIGGLPRHRRLARPDAQGAAGSRPSFGR